MKLLDTEIMVVMAMQKPAGKHKQVPRKGKSSSVSKINYINDHGSSCLFIYRINDP